MNVFKNKMSENEIPKQNMESQIAELNAQIAQLKAGQADCVSNLKILIEAVNALADFYNNPKLLQALMSAIKVNEDNPELNWRWVCDTVEEDKFIRVRFFYKILDNNKKYTAEQVRNFKAPNKSGGYESALYGFQDPATPIAERIIEIHHHVFFFLVTVLIFVSWMLYSVLLEFWYAVPENNKLSKNELKTIKLLSVLKSTHNTILEIIWTMIPSFILIAIALPSFGLLYAMDDVIDPDMTLKAIGHQWYWSYEWNAVYVDDTTIDYDVDSYMLPLSDLVSGDSRLLEVDNVILLPIGTYVRVNVTSSDVLHCWALPSLGIKIDAVPQRINSGIIYLQRTGVFFGQCSEICGVNHGFMPIKLIALQVSDYLNLNENLIQNV